MSNDKIDIVYLWVDGGDKKWCKERDYWYEKIHNKKPEQTNNYLYRDNGELKYSLRSVEKFVPWINHIYIVTGFNQKPKWLNTNNPKITIVPHEQIMPADALPTFNSTAIEMCTPNIPNLSEKFILMNDDTFFNKPVHPNFFFDKNNRAIVFYNKFKNIYKHIHNNMCNDDEYATSLILSNLKISEIFGKKLFHTRPSHGIDPYLKSSWIKCSNHPSIKPIIDKQIYNKFRTKDELHRWLFNMYAYFTGTAIFKKAHSHKSGKHKISACLYNAIHWYKINVSPIFCLDAMQHDKSIQHAPIFCINDSDDISTTTIKNNIEYLKKLFQNKSKFEK